MKRVFTKNILTSADSTDIAVAGAVTVYTKVFKLAFGEYFCLSYKATVSAGAPDLKIELQQSFQEPTTEGATDSNWVEPENMADIETSLTTETYHHKSLSPVTLPFARLKITGAAGNAASTVLNAKISQQEEL